MPGTICTVITFRAPAPLPGFTTRDLIELAGWHAEGRRLVVEDGRDAVPGFAMIYEGGAPWASWGISRQGAAVLVWNCVTLADLGRFDTVAAALAAVPCAADAMPAARPLRHTAEVVMFRPVALAG